MNTKLFFLFTAKEKYNEENKLRKKTPFFCALDNFIFYLNVFASSIENSCSHMISMYSSSTSTRNRVVVAWNNRAPFLLYCHWWWYLYIFLSLLYILIVIYTWLLLKENYIKCKIMIINDLKRKIIKFSVWYSQKRFK